MISLDSVVVTTSEQVSSDLADEVVILNLQNGMYYGLNPVGSLVWNLMREPVQVASLRDAVLQRYAVDATTCAQDLLALLEELAAAALIVVQMPDHA